MSGWVNAVRPRVTRLPYLDLFNFKCKDQQTHSFKRWLAWSDKNYGGNSTSSFGPRISLDAARAVTLPEGWGQAYDTHSQRVYYYDFATKQPQWELPLGGVRNGAEVEDVGGNFAVFSGDLDTKIPDSLAAETVSETEAGDTGKVKEGKGKKVVRLGFAAAKSTLPWYLQDVSDFDALEVKFKSDGRQYTLNVQPESFFQDDLYQGYIQIDKQLQGQWVVAKLPFADLLLTGRGRIKEVQRSFDHDVITSLGLTIADDKNGPFRLEVEYIRATRM